MSRITCQRCGVTAKDNMTANAARWAWPLDGGAMCMTCHDGLQLLREKHQVAWSAKYRAWMAKGKK